MKKKIVIFIGLLFILFFYGCKEDAVDPIPVVDSKYIIQVNQNGPGGVTPSGAITAIKGETLALVVTKDIGIISTATLNGTEIPLENGKYYVPVTSNATVNVEFEKTPRWQLAQHPWSYVSREVRLLKTNGYIYTAYVPEGLKYVKLTFDEDTVKGYDISGKRVISMEYSVIGKDSITLGNGIRAKILKLTDDELQYSAPSPAYEVYPVVKRVPEKDQLFIETYKK